MVDGLFNGLPLSTAYGSLSTREAKSLGGAVSSLEVVCLLSRRDVCLIPSTTQRIQPHSALLWRVMEAGRLDRRDQHCPDAETSDVAT